MVELAAYDRVHGLGRAWLVDLAFEWVDAEHITKIGEEILAFATSSSFLDEDYVGTLASCNKRRAVAGISCVISLLSLGDVDQNRRKSNGRRLPGPYSAHRGTSPP